MKKQNSKCKKSPTGQHELVYPRLEDSVDKDRRNEMSTPIYCKFCLKQFGTMSQPLDIT